MPCKRWPVRNKQVYPVGTGGTGSRAAGSGVAIPLERRLHSLVGDRIATHAKPDHAFACSIEVTGECPERLYEPLVRIAGELVDHALQYGMALLRRGRIEIAVIANPDGSTELLVRDNGWQPLCHAWMDEDRGTVQRLAREHGATFSSSRRDEWTEAVVRFPGQTASNLRLTVLGYGVGILSMICGALAAQVEAQHGIESMHARSLCIASVILIGGSECPANSKLPSSGQRLAGQF
ncbi:MAG TPA: ATP-binding protein [Acetobacteraceae bacterium]|nr:ATP-binding protein [Acetobacteraceae bacterium]